MSKTDGVVLMQRTRTNTRTQMPDWRAAANRSQRATEMEFTQVCTAHSSTPKWGQTSRYFQMGSLPE